jgi:hypothetical protein
MEARRLAAAAFSLVVLAAAGCGESPPPRKPSFLEDNPWVVKSATVETGRSTPAKSPEPPKPAEFKPDSEIVSPILDAKGKWTVRLIFFYPDVKAGLSGLHYANNHARTLRQKGYEAYVTDLVSFAIVSIGSFNDERDPELIKIWRESYEDWLKIRGGRKSAFREEMERFYGEKTVFGDQPWPVSIIELQVQMKGAYKIPLTEEDKKRYKDFLNARTRRSENP